MKTRPLLTLIVLILTSFSINAQLPNGSIGPDFTVTDINNNTHNLYDILDQGKSVVLDLSATWCGPCWNYHQTHILQDLYEQFGPNGTNEIEIFMLEADFNTNLNCLYGPSGCNGSTWGDWTAGIDYPIVNLGPNNGPTVKNDYALSYYPTLYKICPNRKVYEVGQASLQIWSNWISSCKLESSGVVTDAICFDDVLAGVDLTTTGGYGGISYSWSNGATTEDISGYGTGEFSCTVTEGYGHSIEIGPFTVGGPSAPLAATLNDQGNVNCNGNNDGYINIDVSGGGPGYQYIWSNGATWQDINSLSGGIYNVTVTDNFGCTETLGVTVYEPPALELSTTVFDENCGQQDGSIALFASGGTGAYTYDIGNGPSPYNFFDNLTAGVYNASVTDGNYCIEILLTVIGEVPGPDADAGDDQNITCDNNNIMLDGMESSTGNNIIYNWTTNDGNIVSGGDTQTPTVDQPGTYTISVINIISGCESLDDVLVEGSIEAPDAVAGEDDELNCIVSLITLDGSNSSSGNNITYEWLNDNDEVISNDAITEVDIPGIYRLVVLNTENNCSEVDTVVVSENLTVPTSDAGDDDELNCTNSTITLDGSNSSTGSNISYEWLNENDDVISNEIYTDIDIPGTYRLIVHDTINGCTQEDEVVISENLETPVADAGNDNEINCVNETVTLDGSNSTSGNNISYEWLNEDDDVISTEESTDIDVPGTYRLFVLNTESGCIEVDTVEISENLETPTSNAGNDDILNCYNSTVIVDGSNSTGNNMTFEWLDENDEVISNDTIASIALSGTYKLIVTNTESGCTDESAITISEDIELPVANAGQGGELTCAEPSITLDGSESSIGNEFVYEWKNSNGNTIGTTISIDVSTEDDYTLIVTDTINGCSSSADVNVTASNDFPNAVVSGDNELTCSETYASLDGSQSSSGSSFSYQWYNSNNDVIGTEINIDVSEADTYTFVVSDNENGCTASTNFIVSENLEAPEAIIETPDPLNCIVETVTLDASNSIGDDLSFEWYDELGNLLGNNATIEVANPGNITVTVTNNINGCENSSQATVLEDFEPPIAEAQPEGYLDCINTITTIDGSNSSTGDHFVYEWTSNDGIILEGGDGLFPTIEGAGIYNLVVTNLENGCTASTDVEVILDAQLPEVDAGEDAALHCNLSSIVLDGSGSTGPQYSYAWETVDGNIVSGETSLTPTIDAIGVYILTVFNSENGCSESAEVEITSIPDVEIEFESIEDVACFGDATGSVSLNTNGGLEPFTYEWSNGLNTPAIENLTSGNYSVTVSDINDCTATSDVSITEPEAINLDIDEIINETEGNSNGSIQISVDGGIQPYTYEWILNSQVISNDEDLVNAQAGDYQVIITDANGCIVSSETIIVDNITATFDPVLAKYIDVLPNPSSGNLNVNIDLPESKMVNISIMDITGKVVLKTKNENVSTRQYEFDLMRFSDGLYILKISTDDGIFTEKIILEKL